ncbi:hypothetical protein GALL_109390 [mine drainage metagenome]|uniref:Capsule assembly protein Wzi n=1 Tax=mine drainage metagenome TaxID=410659 RepID=A0A1J5SSN7_9ZZZZ
MANDYLRREQLNNSSFINVSFCVRPVPLHYLDSTVEGLQWNKTKKLTTKSSIFSALEWLPFTISQEYNSLHPYGWNDGAMIPAAGYQVLMSAGIYAQIGKLSVQIQPEIIAAQNSNFETFSIGNYDAIWASYYQWLNTSDIPERFGDNKYKRILPGQSSVRYNAGNMSIGISTENMWWGPGRHNALVMSNNASGFLHATINTVKPIETKIGAFEGQIIGGQLSNSNILPPDINRANNGVLLYQPKNPDERYISGMVLTWQPKWVRGLFLGFAKASYLYKSDISGIADILPLEGIMQSNSEKQNKKSSLGSVFFRYVMPEENAEVYAEYGRSDRSASIINLISDKDYPRGYVVGMRKLSDKRANGGQIEFAAEVTQLELPNATLINQAKSWYTNDYVRQGYTNNGKVIGAGIGPGSNSQMIDISWVKGMNKIGLMFERLVHNNDFYYYAFTSPPDYTRHWIDLSTTFHADWKYKRFLFSSEVALIRSLNYEWYVIPGSAYFKNGYDFLNLHGRLSVSYRL